MKMIRKVGAAVLILAVVAVGAVIYSLARRSTEVPAHGQELYTRYCASCHGVGGKGDGRAAEALEPRPTDLTRLRERYGGSSPLREIMAAIDGRRPVRAHGDSVMPVWGVVFEQEMEETEVRWPRRTTLHKVRLISEYVLSLQH